MLLRHQQHPSSLYCADRPRKESQDASSAQQQGRVYRRVSVDLVRPKVMLHYQPSPWHFGCGKTLLLAYSKPMLKHSVVALSPSLGRLFSMHSIPRTGLRPLQFATDGSPVSSDFATRPMCIHSSCWLESLLSASQLDQATIRGKTVELSVDSRPDFPGARAREPPNGSAGSKVKYSVCFSYSVAGRPPPPRG